MILVDILIGTLVLFPFLTAGISFELPGSYFIDLSDFGIPLLLIALVAAAVRGLSRAPSGKSLGAREGRKLAQAWRDALEHFPGRTLWRAAAVLAALFLLVLLWRHWPFEKEEFDLGIVVWNLTHGTGVVLVVALAAAAVRRWSSEPWQKSFFIHQGTKVAQAWRGALERTPELALWGAAGAVGALFFWVAVLRHGALETHGFDLGIFTNAIWNLTHGNGYVSSVKGGINLFTDHQSPLFWLLAPLFWIIPRPETLLFAQAFGLAAGGPALFYLARTQFGPTHWAAAALPWLYWSYLPLRNANAFDFHPEVFMLPLFLWAFVGFASKRGWARGLGLLALVGALGAKESAAVVAVGIGIAWALSSSVDSWRKRWPGIALVLAGVALFFFDVKVVPRFFGGDYAYMGLYERFGGGIVDLLLAPFVQPGYFFSQILNYQRLVFLFWTLAPLGFLPLFNWRAAVAVLPPYLMLFLSEGDQRVRLVFHYGIEPGCALFWALPLGLAAFARWFGWYRAGIWMLFWGLACLGPSELTRARNYTPTAHRQWLAEEVMPCVNKEAPTAASDVLVPHLATRAWISYPELLLQHPSLDPVHCVVTDLRVSNWPLGRGGVERVLEDLPNRGYREVWRCNSFSVYELGESGCLRCVPRCLIDRFEDRPAAGAPLSGGTAGGKGGSSQ
jgi:uncharacterized membrane protein